MENIEDTNSKKDSYCSEEKGNSSCTKCPEAKETAPATTTAEESEFKVHDCDIGCEGCQ